MDIILLLLAKPVDEHGITLVHITYLPLGNGILKVSPLLLGDSNSLCFERSLTFVARVSQLYRYSIISRILDLTDVN